MFLFRYSILKIQRFYHEIHQVEWSQKDGDYVHKGSKLGKVYGSAQKIVVAERVVLNFMQRMSGIATLTKVLVNFFLLPNFGKLLV